MRFSPANTFILALTCMVIIPVLAIDLVPGDIVAPKPGAKQLLLSYLSSDRNDLYKNNVVTSGLGIKSEQMQIRTAWTFEVDNYPAAITLQLAGGSLQPTGSLSNIRSGSSGLGDTTLLFALWLYANRDKGEYLALGTYLTLPTGEYQSAPNFNLGANRYSYSFQVGYQIELSSSLQWMSAIDAVQFGLNDDYRAPLPLALAPPRTTLDQKTLYSLQTGVRYMINDAYSISAMYFSYCRW